MVKNNYTGTRNRYISRKTGKTFDLRSMLERRFIETIEKDNKVVTYDYESLDIPYRDNSNRLRTYKPDFIVIYANRTIEIIEVKPETFVMTEEVQLKKNGVETFLSIKYKDFKVSFRIVTDKDLDKIQKKPETKSIQVNVKKGRRRKKSSVTRHRDNGVKRA
jgi:hypothetical protein